MSKICVRCEIEKDDLEFKKGNTCIQCMKEYKRQHYLANKDLYIQRSSTNYRENREIRLQANKEYRDLNRDKLKEMSKAYYTSEVGRAKNTARSKKYQATKLGKLKFDARTKLRCAIDSGKVSRPNSCSSCKIECIPEGHHIDYAKPLEVEWLCKQCHESRHHLNEGQ